MPNYCSNFLTVTQTKENKKSYAQLRQFVKDAFFEGEIILEQDAESMKAKIMEESFDRTYRDNAAKYLDHSEMNVTDFLRKVAGYEYIQDKKLFMKGHSHLSMNKMLPVPIELMDERLSTHGPKENDKLRAETKAQFGFESWYDWRIANWGTKWDVEPVIEDNDTYVNYNFESAWTPPSAFLITIAERYPLLTFRLNFEEPGCDFEGDLEIVNGEIERDETREYSGGDDDWDDDDENS